MIDRRIAPEFKIADKINYLPPQVSVMSNGIKLYNICAGTQDVMRFVIVFDAGTCYQPQAFVAAATLNMLSEGTAHCTATEIAEKFDFYGSFFELNIDRDWATLSVYCLTKYCDETLQLVEELIKRPIFPDRNIEVYKQKQKQALRIEMEKVAFIARRQFLASLYGDQHPYGSSGKLEEYDLLTREQLLQFHQHYFTSANAFVVLAGNVGKREQEFVERYFGSAAWGDYAKPKDGWIDSVAEADISQFIHKDDAVQSAIRVGKVLFSKHHPDFTGMQVLNTLFGGYFGSRLMMNIREDKGYTYDIYSALIPQKHSGYLSVITEAGSEYTQNVLNEIQNEIYALQNELVPEEELELVKNYIFGEVLRTLDGPWGQSEVCIDNVQMKLPENYVDLFFNEVLAITPVRLQQLARQYLNYDDMCKIVVGSN